MDNSALRAGGTGLRFRPFEPADIPAVHEYASDPDVCRWSTWGPNTPEQTASFVEDAVRASIVGRSTAGRSAAGSPTAFTLAAVVGGTAIGSVSVWTTDAHDRNGELGYTFHRAHWGRGYATEAVRHLLHLGFDALGLERISATCHPGNAGSIRVLEKNGFTHEGLMRSDRLVNGVRRDSLLFSKLRGEHVR